MGQACMPALEDRDSPTWALAQVLGNSVMRRECDGVSSRTIGEDATEEPFRSWLHRGVEKGVLSVDYFDCKTRFGPHEVLDEIQILSVWVNKFLNSRFLTTVEIEYAYQRWRCDLHELDGLRQGHASPHNDVNRPYRQALAENRDLHAKIADMRKETKLTESGEAHFRSRLNDAEAEIARLKGRERELVAIYRAMPYADYLKTAHWQNKRDEAMNRAAGKCSVCASTSNLQAHHNTYERRGEELPTDLTVLCRPCHAKYHGKPE